MKKHLNSIFQYHIVTAICFIAVGLIVNQWLLVHFFRPLTENGKLVFGTCVLIWAFQIFFISAGLLLIFKGKTPHQRRRLLFVFFSMVLMVFFTEGILHLFNLVLHFEGQKKTTLDKSLLSVYKDKEWAQTLLEENRNIPKEFQQFLGWSRTNYHGIYVNIDSQGARKTWNPTTVDKNQQTTVYMFGGSTMFGVGARDDYTIASWTSKLLNEKSGNYIVSNYGQSGYNVTQEIMKLILLLRQGHRPDYVLFYDGINDVYGAYQSGKAGTFQNVEMMRKKLKRKNPTPMQHFMLAVKGTILNHSIIYKAIEAIPSLFVKKSQFQEVAAKYTKEELHELSRDITDYYLQSIDLLDKLSQSYGFEYICFWQPVIFTERQLTAKESDLNYHPRLKDKNLGAVYTGIVDLLEARSPRKFYNISNALEERTETVYTDYCHLSERGNEMMANKIVEIFKEEYAIPY